MAASHSKQSRNRRPAQQIYRPGHLRHGRDNRSVPHEENNYSRQEGNDAALGLNSTDEERSQGSKESSGEVLSQDIQKRLNDLHIKSSSSNSKYGDERNLDSKRRGKRPEIQRYIPKGKVSERERMSEEKEGSHVVQDDVHQDSAPSGLAPESADQNCRTSPRKVLMKPVEGGMRVTVMNESKPLSSNSWKSPSSERKGPHGSRHDQNQEDWNPEDEWAGMTWHSSTQRRGGGAGRGMRNQGQSFDGSQRYGRRRDEQNAALKSYSYSRNRRSNSSDGRQQEEDSSRTGGGDQNERPYNFSSETFPRRKRGGGANRNQHMASLSKDLNGNGGNKTGARDGDKLYMGVTRQRTGSISSEASCASHNSNSSMYSGGSSDWGTEEDEPEHILNWAEEVEKAHLEEVARLVHHGAQELTSSLNCYPASTGESPTQESPSVEVASVMSDKNQKQPPPLLKESVLLQLNQDRGFSKNRHRRRTRSRKSASQYGSRDSSVHSSIQGDEDCFSERGGMRRRRRRRNNSGRSQSGRLEGRQDEEMRMGGFNSWTDRDGNRSGLKVTVGQNNRLVAVQNENKGNKNHCPSQGNQWNQDFQGRDIYQRGLRKNNRQEKQFGGSVDENRNERQFHRQEKDVPPRFRKDSGGSCVSIGSDLSTKRSGRGRGNGGRGTGGHEDGHERTGFSKTGERIKSISHTSDHQMAQEASSRVSQRGRGRVNPSVNSHRRRVPSDSSGGKERRDNKDLSHSRSDGFRKAEESGSKRSQKLHGLIHLPVKMDAQSSSSIPGHLSASSSISSTATVTTTTSTHHHRHHPPPNPQHAPKNHPPLSTLSLPSSQAPSSVTSSVSSRGPIQGQKQLYDPDNPSKPIVMQADTKPQPNLEAEEQRVHSPNVAPLSSSPSAPTDFENSSMAMSYPPAFYPPHPRPVYGFRPPHPYAYPMGGPPFPCGPPLPPSHPMYYHHMASRLPSPDMSHYYGV